MEDDVTRVKDATDLVQFFGEYTNLNKAGKNFKGTCPLHQEETPSFFLRPERGLWYCFGCQKGGDVFNFLMEKEHLTFGEALQLLAKRAGIRLTGRYDSQAVEEKENLFRILSIINEFYVEQLTASSGKVAQEYLRKREISHEMVEHFSLGFAPDSWDATSSYLKKRGFKEDDIVLAGLAIKRNKGTGVYDRFRNRLMFPVKDHLGRIVGFSGRLLSGDKEAKYINTPETPLFKKGKLLYGYSLADESARAKGYTILVEGNLDVVSLVQSGIPNVVAPLGTGLSSDQLTLLNRISNKLLLVFDQDSAGQKATHRAILEAAKEGFETKVAQISGAKDPDEAVHKDRKTFINDLRQAVPAFRYLLINAQKENNSDSAYGKKKIAEALFEFISLQPENVVKENYVDQLSSELGTRVEALRKDMVEWQRHHQVNPDQKVMMEQPRDESKPVSVTKNKQEKLEDYYIALLFNLPDMVLSQPKFKEVFFMLPVEAFTQEIHQKVLSKLQAGIGEEPVTNLDAHIVSMSEKELKQVDSIIMRDFGNVLQSEKIALRELQRTTIEITQLHYRRVLKRLARQKQQSDDEGKEKINVSMREITEKLRQLETAG
ncbi:DNA primase [candidate division WWE3 bacterium]|uniref:DNA primase n=1 Tax=candidate division WWE3 bacterium TaxID=2053526 RepID=A0A955RWR1_UNCKA|nr:DNA primase [candidate division WWE3 bacterium]